MLNSIAYSALLRAMFSEYVVQFDSKEQLSLNNFKLSKVKKR